jgi:thiamine-phosphate pyrophosphorylase
VFNKENLMLYAITDNAWLNGRRLYDDVKKALEGGATMIQLREKNKNFDNIVSEAKELLPLCHSFNAPLIINDYIDVCIKSGADGVHLGQNDTPLLKARALLGKDSIIGITAKTTEQAIAAENDGADYVGSGAVFGTSTKLDTIKMDLDTLKNICNCVNIPVAAIGGINSSNILELSKSGISGVAVVSGIFASSDIEAAARDLRNKIKYII